MKTIRQLIEDLKMSDEEKKDFAGLIDECLEREKCILDLQQEQTEKLEEIDKTLREMKRLSSDVQSKALRIKLILDHITGAKFYDA